MSFGALAAATFRKTWAETRRYLFNTLSGIVTLYAVFLLIFLGARAVVSGPGRGDTLEAIVAGYFLWTLAIMAFGDSAQELIGEAQIGTLEQLAMSPFGLTPVLMLRFLANMLWALIIASLLLLLMMATTGQWLRIDVVSVLPIVVLATFSAYGVGLMAGGLGIVFKRVANFLQILQFVFVALIAFPVDRAPWLAAMPIAWGSELLRRVMVDGVALWEMPVRDSLALLAVSLGWVGAGALVFRLFERAARERSLLGQY